MTTNTKSKMLQTSETATEFWNDSCSLRELAESIQDGAVGATSNPVVITRVMKQEYDVWEKVLESLFQENPYATEEEIAWQLISKNTIEVAKLFNPLFTKSRGLKGRTSVQLNPAYYMNKERMVEQALFLSQLAPNVDIKVPCTASGIEAVEEITANGVVINSTVCFTLSQTLACAEAVERGFKKAANKGFAVDGMHPHITINIGRIDDHLKDVMREKYIDINPDYLEWAGIGVVKKAYKIFQERGYRSTLLIAAFRNYLHWSEMIGGKIALTIAYSWWKRYNDSDIVVTQRMDTPVDYKIIEELRNKFEDFRKAYDLDAMTPDEFICYGATIKTLNQFVSSYYDLLNFIREKRLVPLQRKTIKN